MTKAEQNPLHHSFQDQMRVKKFQKEGQHLPHGNPRRSFTLNKEKDPKKKDLRKVREAQKEQSNYLASVLISPSQKKTERAFSVEKGEKKEESGYKKSGGDSSQGSHSSSQQNPQKRELAASSSIKQQALVQSSSKERSFYSVDLRNNHSLHGKVNLADLLGMKKSNRSGTQSLKVEKSVDTKSVEKYSHNTTGERMSSAEITRSLQKTEAVTGMNPEDLIAAIEQLVEEWALVSEEGKTTMQMRFQGMTMQMCMERMSVLEGKLQVKIHFDFYDLQEGSDQMAKYFSLLKERLENNQKVDFIFDPDEQPKYARESSPLQNTQQQGTGSGGQQSQKRQQEESGEQEFSSEEKKNSAHLFFKDRITS